MTLLRISTVQQIGFFITPHQIPIISHALTIKIWYPFIVGYQHPFPTDDAPTGPLSYDFW